MLVVTRGISEQIVIRDDIVVTLLDIRGDKARIGIEAPKEVPVWRKEIWLDIQKENLAGQEPQ